MQQLIAFLLQNIIHIPSILITISIFVIKCTSAMYSVTQLSHCIELIAYVFIISDFELVDIFFCHKIDLNATNLFKVILCYNSLLILKNIFFTLYIIKMFH